MGIPIVPDDTPTSWINPRTRVKSEVTMPGWRTALGRGLAMRCPRCGRAPAFDGYLKVRPECPVCAAPLGRVPCDDAPPYITLLISLHIMILIMVLADYDGGMGWIESMIIFVPLTIVLLLLMLRPVKGLTLAIMLKVNLLRPAKPRIPAPHG